MKMVIGKQTAQETTTLVSEELIKKSPAKAVIGEERLSQEMEEMKSKRGRRSKFYSDGKNHMKAEFYEKAIHILNYEKNEYEDIDLRFKDDGEILTPKANCFQSKFYKNLNNGKIFEMEKDKNIYTTITVYKNRLPKYLQDNYTKVLLKMKASSSSKINGFMIGHDYFDSYKSEFSADVTAFFNEDKETAVIHMSNYYNFTELRENDITFNPPCLVIEYENKIVSIVVVSQPKTTNYIPGDNFSTEGMRVQATYEDGSKRFLSKNEYNYYPTGALIKSDDKVIISCVENPEIVCNVDIVVDNNEFYFSDRRAKKEREGYYTMQNIDADGNLEEGVVVKLTLNDGASQEDEGTSLNAANLNKIIKKLIENGVLSTTGDKI